METEVWLTFRLYILNDMENHGKLSDRKEPICVPEKPKKWGDDTQDHQSSQGAKSW